MIHYYNEINTPTSRSAYVYTNHSTHLPHCQMKGCTPCGSTGDYREICIWLVRYTVYFSENELLDFPQKVYSNLGPISRNTIHAFNLNLWSSVFYAYDNK